MSKQYSINKKLINNSRVHSVADFKFNSEDQKIEDELGISFDRQELGAIIKNQQTMFTKNKISEENNNNFQMQQMTSQVQLYQKQLDSQNNIINELKQKLEGCELELIAKNKKVRNQDEAIFKQQFIIKLQTFYINKLKNTQIDNNLSPEKINNSVSNSKFQSESNNLNQSKYNLPNSFKKTKTKDFRPYQQPQEKKYDESLYKSSISQEFQQIFLNDKMPLGIKETILHPSPVKEQEDQLRLIEDFFVIGVKCNALQGLKDKTQTVVTEPTIIYRYLEQIQSESQTNLNYVQSVPKFCFPQGLECLRIDPKKDHNQMLNRLVFKNQKDTLNSYVILLKSHQFLENDTIQHPNQVFIQSNPNKMLYVVCFEIETFIVEPQPKGKQPQYYKTPNVYCILTHFPFFPFFLEIMIKYIKQCQLKKTEYYTHSNQLIDIGQNFFRHFYFIELTLMLDQLFNFNQVMSDMHQSFEFLNTESLSLLVPGINKCQTLEINYSLPTLAHSLSPQIITQLVLALLLEKSVVFCSIYKHLLTNIIIVIKALLFPLVWNHPVLSIMPQELETLLESPVPILLGLNETGDSIQQRQLTLRYPNLIFVDLDAQLIMTPDALTHFPSQESQLMDVLQPLYAQFQQHLIITPQYDVKHNIIQQFNQQTESPLLVFYQLLMESVQTFIKNTVVNPFKQIILQNYKNNYSQINTNLNESQLFENIWDNLQDNTIKNDLFYQALIETQNFNCFFEQLIQNKI